MSNTAYKLGLLSFPKRQRREAALQRVSERTGIPIMHLRIGRKCKKILVLAGATFHAGCWLRSGTRIVAQATASEEIV